jgi:hypothetical protein
MAAEPGHGPTTLEVAGAEPLTEVFVELRPVAAVAHLAALRASSRLHEARARDGLGGADSEKPGLASRQSFPVAAMSSDRHLA